MGSLCTDCVRRSHPPRSQRIRHGWARQRTPFTAAIIVVNVAVFLWLSVGAAMPELDGIVNRREFDLALSKVFIDDGQWWRLVTSGFLHFGAFHIGMNMLLLWQLGSILEPALDRGRFVLLYLASLMGGAAGALLVTPDALTGGASGAVFGLMAAATVAFQQRGVNPFRIGIGTILVINLVITFTVPGISVGGHVGGALMGAACGWAMLEPRWMRREEWAGWVAPLAGIAVSLFLVYVVA